MVEQAYRSGHSDKNRLKLEAPLSELPYRVPDPPAADVDREILDAQRRVSELLGIDPLVLRQWLMTTQGMLTLTHLYCAKDDALRRSEARLASGAMLAGLGYYELGHAENDLHTDDRFRDICGLPHGQDGGPGALQFWMDHLHPDDRQHVLDKRQELRDGKIQQASVEYRYLHPTRGLRWIQHMARLARREGEKSGIVTFGVLRDISEVKRNEAELRDLSQRLILAHEEERALLARELHDDVTQRLAVLAIEVGRAEMAAPGGAQAAVMHAVREGITRLSEDIHSLAYQLHPSVLVELGLVAALQAECERMGRQGGLSISVDLDPLPAISKDAALCLFRVAQEALNNVSRHAGARAASVALRRMDGGMLLVVRDDGVGFDPGRPRTGRSLGLASMRERMRLVGGRLDIESAPSLGTAISAWVPGEEPA